MTRRSLFQAFAASWLGRVLPKAPLPVFVLCKPKSLEFYVHDTPVITSTGIAPGTIEIVNIEVWGEYFYEAGSVGEIYNLVYPYSADGKEA
jgi:hypothetical protein